MRKFIALQLILVTISSFGQSPWTQKKGKVFSHLSFSTISGYNSLFGNPDFNTERKISDKTLQLFTEYGVSDKTSLLINIPFKMIETGVLVNEVSAEITTISNKNTFGNINIGLKHNFINKKWLMSGQFLVEANTSSYESSSGIRTGFDAWSFSPMLIVGRSFNKTYLQSNFIFTEIETSQLGLEEGARSVTKPKLSIVLGRGPRAMVSFVGYHNNIVHFLRMLMYRCKFHT